MASDPTDNVDNWTDADRAIIAEIERLRQFIARHHDEHCRILIGTRPASSAEVESLRRAIGSFVSLVELHTESREGRSLH